MKKRELNQLKRELLAFLDEMLGGMGRSERREALRQYLTGLLLDGQRKSIQPMAARLAGSGEAAEALRQRLQQAVVVSPWSEKELYRRLAKKLERELPRIDAMVIDDTGFQKKGNKSVGVARQYSGTWGRTDNGQVAVSLHLASEQGSGMIGMRLYLPKVWTDDRPRCDRAGVPEEIGFQPKWEIALGLIDEALAWGIRRHPVLGDAAYGDVPEFRAQVDERGLPFVLGISGDHSVWPPGAEPQVPEHRGQRGRPRTRHVDPNGAKPMAISELARTLSYERVEWREGSRGRQWARFAAVRVQMAERHQAGRPPSEELWLICEWPRLEGGPTKFYVSNLHSKTELKTLVVLIKRRWRVERDYQELKDELGLDHYEGRTWRGFHHHAALCALAHGFLSLRRALFPPQQGEVDLADGEERASEAPHRADRDLPSLQAPL